MEQEIFLLFRLKGETKEKEMNNQNEGSSKLPATSPIKDAGIDTTKTVPNIIKPEVDTQKPVPIPTEGTKGTPETSHGQQGEYVNFHANDE
jgi:hypothetical protein